MVVRIKVALEQEEYSGLLRLALSEMRNPQEQMRFVLQQELKRLGLLHEDDKLFTKTQCTQRRKRKTKRKDQSEKQGQILNLEDLQGSKHHD